jgi:hypothetical protein
MGKTKRAILATLLSAGVVVTSGPPASAVDGYQETVPGIPTGDGGCGDDRHLTSWGDSCFVADGDVFWLYDRVADRQSVGVQWHLRDRSRSGLIRDPHGQGVNTIRNKDFPEEKWVVWRLGKCNVTSSQDCHRASHFNSFTAWICSPVDGSASLEARRACYNEAN